jgi:hypothetical protein
VKVFLALNTDIGRRFACPLSPTKLKHKGDGSCTGIPREMVRQSRPYLRNPTFHGTYRALTLSRWCDRHWR